ncbi:hypothetical protein ACIGZJ_34560 [Kitasatospora sp. NPDC052868]|uniref:hypothetical protein n=1 Tax=Kitasatospora sp. NPDC052868 TaxID=3364060 RepID=UPI0037CB8659
MQNHTHVQHPPAYHPAVVQAGLLLVPAAGSAVAKVRSGAEFYTGWAPEPREEVALPLRLRGEWFDFAGVDATVLIREAASDFGGTR